MKKQLTTIILLVLSLSLLAQNKPKDSTIVQIQIDTASLKVVQNLIIENVKGEPTTKQLVVNNIFGILFKNAKMVTVPKSEAIKPKEQPTKTK